MPTKTTNSKEHPTPRAKRQTFVIPPREQEQFEAIIKARHPYDTRVESMVFRELIREEYARMQQAKERETSKS